MDPRRVYAIGDVHGQCHWLMAAHARIMHDRARTGDDWVPVVHLGDLCDRGPDSRGVIDFLLNGITGGMPWVALRGNHDWMMLNFVQSDPYDRWVESWLWPNIGGRTTLRSYGVAETGSDVAEIQRAARAACPARHVDFLETQPLWVETEDLILVHAGIRHGVPMPDQDPTDLTWIRDDFLNDARDHGKLVVHGHTPVDYPEHHGNRVNLDTGAGFGLPLTVAVFEGRDAWVLGENGRAPLYPLT